MSGANKGSIQQKIVVSKIMNFMKSNSDVTKVSLKRSLPAFEAHFEAGFKYAVEHEYLSVAKWNYVATLKDEFIIYEEDYYDCVEEMLRELWTKIIGRNGHFILERTARKDSKIAGRWTRPDFTIVSQRKFPYIRQEEFDICTFEVKRPENCDALAVFEALAHTSAATRSFVFFPMTALSVASLEQGERIEEECVKHGIGLISVEDEFSLDRCSIKFDAQRRFLNQEKCSNFLQNVLSPKALAELSRW